MKKFDVVGIGVPVTDIFLVNPEIVQFSIESGSIKKTFIGLETGSKSPSHIENFTGGSSANSLAALAKLGNLSLAYVCVVGTDQYSNILIEDLETRGIDVTGVIRKHGFSPGVSVIITGTGGVRDRAISVDHGTGEHLTERDLLWASDVIRSAKWLDITSLPSKSIVPVRTFVRSLKKENDSPKVFLAPSASMLHRDLEQVQQWICEADALALNDEELLLLTGSKTLQDAFKWLIDKKVPKTFVTRGSQGVMYITAEQVITIPAVKLKSEEIFNTTGAGDISAAMFLLGLLQNDDPLITIQRAAVAGAIKITSKMLGAKSGLPTKEQLEHEFKKHKKELVPRIFHPLHNPEENKTR
ncbi:MAG: carbohydrate kinase family protein [bacterium]|nr:carbohydrate kinase family protein [bacterium]